MANTGSSVYRGYHSHELQLKIAHAWEHNELLFVGSPLMKDVPTFDESAWQDKAKPVLAVLTSGTTASPRFVYYSKENILSSLDAIMSLFDVSRIDTVFCYPQPFHTFGLTLGYVLSLLKGWQLVTPDGRYTRDAHAVRASLKSDRVLTLGTPVHFRDLHKYCLEQKVPLASSYSAIVGGAPVSVDLWRTLQTALNIEAPSIGYGCTEASPGLTHLPPGLMPTADGQIGFVLPNVSMRLRPGIGLEFGGPNTCLAVETATGLLFSQQVLIKDHLEPESDGMLRFCGRFDLTINCGGLKIALEAVEQEIAAELGLQAMCFSVPDERLGEELGVMIASNEPVNVQAIIELVASKFQKRLVKENILLREILSLNVNGKYDRREALNLLLTESTQATATAPLTATLPIAVSSMAEFTPHRGAMVWMDEVAAADRVGGECTVQLRDEAHYMTDGRLRLTSMIEFAAQGFAYVKCAQAMLGHAPAMIAPKKAFLVGTRDTQYFVDNQDQRLSSGAKVRLRISDVREITPFVMYNAEVISASGDKLMSTKMKLYHE